jgi:hypothetical protein
MGNDRFPLKRPRPWTVVSKSMRGVFCVPPLFVLLCGHCDGPIPRLRSLTTAHEILVLEGNEQVLSTCTRIYIYREGERKEGRKMACFHVVLKMYRYSLEERVFIVKTYWITGSMKNCQRRFAEQFGGRNPASKPKEHC